MRVILLLIAMTILFGVDIRLQDEEQKIKALLLIIVEAILFICMLI